MSAPNLDMLCTYQVAKVHFMLVCEFACEHAMLVKMGYTSSEHDTSAHEITECASRLCALDTKNTMPWCPQSAQAQQPQTQSVE